MPVIVSNSRFLFFLICFILSGCTGGGAYLYKDNEFDRDNPDFAKKIKNRSHVEICYNKQTATPQILMKIAQEECKRFGKQAFFEKHQLLRCSIASPAMASFKCVSKK